MCAHNDCLTSTYTTPACGPHNHQGVSNLDEVVQNALKDMQLVRCLLLLPPLAHAPQSACSCCLHCSQTDFENKLAGSLSGGNKRKLSVAIAMMGRPPLLFLVRTCCVLFAASGCIADSVALMVVV